MLIDSKPPMEKYFVEY